MKVRKRLVFFLMLAMLAASAFAVNAAASETYTGIGKGNNGEIKVRVTLENGAITAVDVLEHEETAGLSDPAIEQIPAAIAAANGTDVDAVSGATNTSKGIIAAVNDALAQAGREAEEADTSNVYFGKDYSAYTPRVTTLENGVQVQKTPDSGYPWGWFTKDPNWVYYNTYYLNADYRGCSSCHDLEDCLKNIGHVVYRGEYEYDDMPVQTCTACHSDTYSGNNLQYPIHGLHLGRASFSSMGGSCESCHYIDADGNYLRWDFVKYDVLSGTTDLSADDVNVSVEWNQDQLTDPEDMFVVEWAKNDYGFEYADALHADDVRDTYKVSFEGDLENPCELSINEMIEMFGTETKVLCGQCSINGTGSSLVYQREVTGIPMEKIMEYIGVRDSANMCYMVALDGYPCSITTRSILRSNGLLAFEMEGEELTSDQGYPIAFWCEDQTCGVFVRTLTTMTFYAEDPAAEVDGIYGDFVDVVSGRMINTPNIGVLTEENGTIFTPGETVHLEGYAHAFREPITKLEFSFDHGATWKEISTDNTVSERWVYWKMDIDDLEPGAYVMYMRATSLMANGESRVNEEIPKFLINVK